MTKLKLLGLFLAFFGPLLIATSLYFKPDGFGLVPKAASHGTLIVPAIPLADLIAANPEGESLSRDLLRKKWTLLYRGAQRCNLDCEADLFKMRQVRLALNQNVNRVQTLYLMPEQQISADFRQILARHSNLIVARLTDDKAAITQQINTHLRPGIYLVDPLGNLMAHYAHDAASKGLLRDMKKLLKVSRIG